MGAFRRADPRSPEVEKGYRLRDTDDRLVRMKSQSRVEKELYQNNTVTRGNNGWFKCFGFNNDKYLLVTLQLLVKSELYIH